MNSFAEYTPFANKNLIDVVIKTTNTSSSPLNISDIDYQLQWGLDGFTDALQHFTLSQEPVAAETVLSPNESVEYHYLYFVPDYVGSFLICYSDLDGTLFYSTFSI